MSDRPPIPTRTSAVSLLAPIAVALGTAVTLAGCGSGSAPGQPSTHAVPLVQGVRVVAEHRECDGGAHPFCGRELVLAAPRGGRYASSEALMARETARLKDAGWSMSEGDTIFETAAESPGHRLRLTYATAAADLLSNDTGRITRTPSIARALAGQMYDRAPALSLMLQAGST